MSNLVLFGALSWYFWDAPDRFLTGVFFAVAMQPLVQWLVYKTLAQFPFRPPISPIRFPL